jgi:serine/threonine protein kinase
MRHDRLSDRSSRIAILPWSKRKVWLHIWHADGWNACNELDVLAGNDHATVLRLVVIVCDDSHGHCNILTEFQENGDLESALKREREGTGRCLNVTEKSKVIFGIVCGMAYLHSRGVLHRLLRPNHILLNGHWEPVIGGFEWSCCFHDGFRSLAQEELSFKSCYMCLAPEQFDDSHTDDWPVDVFAFAVALYHIFGPPVPMDSGKPIRIPHYVMQWIGDGGRYVKLPGIPEYHWKVITRCWNGTPEERPTFIELLNEFHRDHTYILSGADRSSVLEYENRVYSDFGPPNSGTNCNRTE